MENMKTHEIDAVIFDLDGTLIDSMWIWADIDRQYLLRKGVNDMPENFPETINGMTFPAMAELFKKKFGIVDSIDHIISEWMDMSREHYKTNIRMKEGAREFVDFLKANNLKIALGTTNKMEMVDIVLEANRFDIDIFDSVVTSDNIQNGKPNPEVFLRSIKDMGVDASRVLIIEDSLNGCKAARNAGAKLISISDNAALHDYESIKGLSLFHFTSWNDFELNGKEKSFSIVRLSRG